MARTKNSALRSNKRRRIGDEFIQETNRQEEPKQEDSTQPPTFKVRRFSQGIRALREIKKYQKTVDFLIPKISFMKVVREITQGLSPGTNYRFGATAFQVLQESAEAYLTELFADTMESAVHAKRVTILPKDITHVRRLRGLHDPSLFQNSNVTRWKDYLYQKPSRTKPRNTFVPPPKKDSVINISKEDDQQSICTLQNRGRFVYIPYPEADSNEKFEVNCEMIKEVTLGNVELGDDAIDAGIMWVTFFL